MGLIKLGIETAKNVLADQWREYFYCDSLNENVLMKKGEKRNTGKANVNGQENIISNGSIIAVNDGQCMIIVDQGKIVEVCADPGEFTYDQSSEPSVFYGPLGTSIVDTFKTVAKRFTTGGEPAKDQRIYFFNVKEIMGNKYGTNSPIPFRLVDQNIGLDVDVEVRCHGQYSYKIVDPLLFYTNVCANVPNEYTRDKLDDQMRTEIMTQLQPALGKISEMGIRYSAITSHTDDLTNIMNSLLSEKWTKLRGIKVVSFGMDPVSLPEETLKMIQDLQRDATLRNPNMAAARLAGAQAQAMQDAAKNENGAMMAFAGMGMATNAGGMNAQQLFAMGQQQNTQQVNPAQNMGQQQVNPAQNMGQTAAAIGWICSACGKVGNLGKFCSECGNPKPAGAKVYKCDKCGWEPEDKTTPPKFCPNCGDVFDDNDVTK